jgi:hypothetical protein
MKTGRAPLGISNMLALRVASGETTAQEVDGERRKCPGFKNALSNHADCPIPTRRGMCFETGILTAIARFLGEPSKMFDFRKARLTEPT